ncbi:hypothetical protein HN937_30555 [Candidatus Poribacteria bacterium]|jgi:hypothetical protein|nr:hypothetical protein [Candidatus Poribacteria bacterium]
MAADANAMLYSGLGDIRNAALLHQEIQLLLADRADLMDDPTIVYLGNKARQGTTVFEIGQVGLDGYDRMAAVAENADAGVTALTDASPNVTIARQSLRRQMSYLAQLTDSVGLDVARLALDYVGAARMRLTEMIAGVTDDFTATVGTSGVDMSVDDYFDGHYTLTQSSVPGPFLCDLYPVQVTDLQNSIRAEGGALQFRDDAQEMLDIKGPGYQGSFLSVPIFASSLVPTANAGADSAGGMFGRGAVGYADFEAIGLVDFGGRVFPAGTKIFADQANVGAGGYTDSTGHYFCGVTLMEDGRGVSMITDR